LFLTPPPDLKVNEIEVTGTGTTKSTDMLEIKYDVTNQGGGSTDIPWWSDLLVNIPYYRLWFYNYFVFNFNNWTMTFAHLYGEIRSPRA